MIARTQAATPIVMVCMLFESSELTCASDVGLVDVGSMVIWLCFILFANAKGKKKQKTEELGEDIQFCDGGCWK